MEYFTRRNVFLLSILFFFIRNTTVTITPNPKEVTDNRRLTHGESKIFFFSTQKMESQASLMVNCMLLAFKNRQSISHVDNDTQNLTRAFNYTTENSIWTNENLTSTAYTIGVDNRNDFVQ